MCHVFFNDVFFDTKNHTSFRYLVELIRDLSLYEVVNVSKVLTHKIWLLTVQYETNIPFTVLNAECAL